MDVDSTTFSQDLDGQQSPTLVEGRLVFADMSAFSDFMTRFIESGEISSGEFEISDDFVSLHASTRELRETAYEEVDVEPVRYNDQFEVVEDPFFSRILNEYGEIQIGVDVFKITRNYVYQALESDIKAIKDIQLRNTDRTAFLGRHGEIDGVSIHKIERAGLDAAGKMLYATDSCTDEFRKRRRIEGWSWITNFRVYQSAGVGTRAQLRSWGRWRSATVEEVSLTTTYTLANSIHRVLSTRGPFTYTDTSHRSHVERVLMYDYGWRGFIYGSISTIHNGTRKEKVGDLQYASCDTDV